MHVEPCRCEHIAHTAREARTPNGNPGHSYGVRFSPSLLRDLKTPYGVFRVCADCADDCLAEHDPEPRRWPRFGEDWR
jgi:hypothetical protein